MLLGILFNSNKFATSTVSGLAGDSALLNAILVCFLNLNLLLYLLGRGIGSESSTRVGLKSKQGAEPPPSETCSVWAQAAPIGVVWSGGECTVVAGIDVVRAGSCDPRARPTRRVARQRTSDQQTTPCQGTQQQFCGSQEEKFNISYVLVSKSRMCTLWRCKSAPTRKAKLLLMTSQFAIFSQPLYELSHFRYIVH